MRALTAFIYKEFVELYRTGKLVLLLILFILFGIMNPAIAKLTPWIMELSAESLKESGMVLGTVRVDAMTSWTQFYKNIPIILIVFVILSSSILTNEYQKGTLINMLTKGLARWKVIAAKVFTVMMLWSVCYWIYYGITYGYTIYFWDNSIVSHVLLGAVYPYLFGIWLITLVFLWSALTKENVGVLAGTGGVVLICYLAGMVSKVEKYLPTQLLQAGELLTKAATPQDYLIATLITIGISVAAMVLSIILFNRRNFWL